MKTKNAEVAICIRAWTDCKHQINRISRLVNHMVSLTYHRQGHLIVFLLWPMCAAKIILHHVGAYPKQGYSSVDGVRREPPAPMSHIHREQLQYVKLSLQILWELDPIQLCTRFPCYYCERHCRTRQWFWSAVVGFRFRNSSRESWSLSPRLEQT